MLEAEIRGKNGSLFLFAGLSQHTVESIKSFEGVDICWLEEAQVITKRSFDVLLPTIRKDGSEVWLSLNPDMETDETYQRFVANPPPNALVEQVNWRDNPWFPEVLEAERQETLRRDPDSYENIWEGKLSALRRVLSTPWRLTGRMHKTACVLFRMTRCCRCTQCGTWAGMTR